MCARQRFCKIRSLYHSPNTTFPISSNYHILSHFHFIVTNFDPLIHTYIISTMAFVSVPLLHSSFLPPSAFASSTSFCPRFTPVSAPSCRSQPGLVHMVTSSGSVPRVTGNNIQVTDSLRVYVEDKLGKTLNKYQQFIAKTDVHLSISHNPSIKNGQAAEVIVFATGKHTIRAEVKSENMYASIDMVADKIARSLRKYKERKSNKGDKKHMGELAVDIIDKQPVAKPRFEQDSIEAFQAGDEEADTDAKPGLSLSDVVKRKSFPMPPQSLEDAIVCLEYIDHDFYVYKDKDTNKISVVYKRTHGGVGLIQPE